MAEEAMTADVRDDSGSLNPEFVDTVKKLLAAANAKRLHELLEEVHPADLADIVEALEPGERGLLITMLGRHFNAEALAELDESVRDELLETLPPDTIAAAVRNLDTDDALYLIEDLDRQEQQTILDKVSPEERRALKRGLDYAENTAGRLM